MNTPRPPARLSILFARDAPVAAIFRTGPVNTTALIEWNTAKDTFRLGQWVKHKIYPERSALSPDGRHLVYFAYKYHLRDGSMGGGFTVISRMPYFTARALFIEGGTWGGGGVFLDNTHVMLRGIWPSGGDRLPDGLKLVFPATTHARARVVQAQSQKGKKKGMRQKIAQAEARVQSGAPYVYGNGKPAQIAPRMRQRFHDAHRWTDGKATPDRSLPPLPDWCVVRDGCLYRRLQSGAERLLKDFNAMRFEPIAAPYA
jgi:hypothetical protein